MTGVSAVDSRGRARQGTRRPHGAGTITEQRPGYFQVRVRAGRDQVVSRAGRGTRTDAERWLNEMTERAVAQVSGFQTREPVPSAVGLRGAKSQPSPSAAAHLFDLAPLLEDRGGNLSVLARTIGVCRETVHRKVRSGLTIDEADEWAMACGLHPIEGWGDVWLAAAKLAP